MGHRLARRRTARGYLADGFDGRSGNWMDTWAAWGTIRPHAGSPGLLFSIPMFLGAGIALRLIFSWHAD